MIDLEDVAREEVFEVRALVGEYGFRLVDLRSPEIRVKIWMMDIDRAGDKYMYEVSHWIHTPRQLGPYQTSIPYASDEAAALDRVMRDMNSYVKEAIQAGHKAESAWLVPNEDY